MKKLIILFATCLIPLLHGAAGGGQTHQDRVRSIPSLRELALKESGQALTNTLPLSLIPQDASSSSALHESTTLPFGTGSTASSSSLSLQRITREDIAAYINSLKIGDTPLANTPLAHELINATASAIAHDEYLRLRSQDKLSPRNAYNKLSPFLQEHFAGVSIQDLINNNLLSNQINGELKLSYLHISSLKGLEFVPNIHNLKKLYLTGNLLTALEPRAFAGLTKLQQLSLRNNQLTYLQPGAFTDLSNLEGLYLSNNQLTALEPGIFTELTNLKYLYLANNQLTTLNPGVFAGLTKLKDLFLNSNQLTALKLGVFKELTNLTNLFLDNNQLTALEPDVFAGQTNLQLLDLNNNQFTQEEQARIRTELQTVAPNAIIEF